MIWEAVLAPIKPLHHNEFGPEFRITFLHWAHNVWADKINHKNKANNGWRKYKDISHDQCLTLEGAPAFVLDSQHTQQPEDLTFKRGYKGIISLLLS